jgi:hypothetical protein
MVRFNIVVPHRLSRAEALRHIQNEIEALKGPYGDKITGLQDNWNSNSYVFREAMGFAVLAAERVIPLQLELDGELPWLALPFKGKIEATIRERLRTILE